MADERLHEMLRPLDGAATPDEGFGDALFERLAPLALAAGRRDRTWHGRVARTIRTAARPLPNPAANQMRTAIVLATVLALLLALAAIVASRRPDPLQIVLGSEAVYRDPPSFDITIGYSDGAIRRFRYDGAKVMRLDVVKGAYRLRPEGTYILMDTSRRATFEWDPAGGTVLKSVIVTGMRPIALLDMRWGADLQTSNLFSSQCLTWEYVEETTVMARPAHHVRCATGLHDEFWVDLATGFVLRSTDVPTDDDRISLTGEVMAFALGVSIDPALLIVEDGPRVAAPMPGGDASFERGVRVVTSRFTPAFAAIPGDGWRSWGTDLDVVGFVRGQEGASGHVGGAVFLNKLTLVTDVATGLDIPLDPGVDAAMEWLRGHPYLETGEVEATRVGALPALSMDYRQALPDSFETACPAADQGQPPACRRWFPAGTGYWSFDDTPPDVQRLTIVDVNGATILILASADGPDREAHLAAIAELIGSIEFLD